MLRVAANLSASILARVGKERKGKERKGGKERIISQHYGRQMLGLGKGAVQSRLLHRDNGASPTLNYQSSDDDSNRSMNRNASLAQVPSQRFKKMLVKMQRFVSSRPTIIDDFLRNRVSTLEFVETLERLPGSALHNFLLEWSSLFHVVARLADDSYQNEKDDTGAKTPTNGNRDVKSEKPTESPPKAVHSNLYQHNSSKPTKTTTLQFTSPSAIIRREKEREKERENAHPISRSPNSPVSSRLDSPHSRSYSDYGSVSPRSSQHLRPQSSKDRLSNSHSHSHNHGNAHAHSAAGSAHLPPLKSSTAEVVAAVQPYLSKYLHNSTLSSSSKDETDHTSKASHGNRRHKHNHDEKDHQKEKERPDQRPNGWHLLRALTALAFASDPGQLSSPEASRHMLSLLNSDNMVSSQNMMAIWSHFSSQQQQQWMRGLIQQFIRVNTSLNLFSKITEETNHRRALAQMLNSITELISATSVSFYSVKSSHNMYSGEMRYLASTGPFNGSALLPIGYGIAGRVAIEKQMLHVVNAKADPRYASSVDGDIPQNTSVLSLPIFLNGNSRSKTFSILQICSAHFAPEDIILLETITIHLGVILENVRSRVVEISMRKKFQALVEIANTMSSQLELQALIDVMRQKSKQLLEADKCTLFMVDAENKQLWTRLEEGQEISFPMNSGIAGYVSTTGETVNIPDAYKDPRFRHDVDANTGYRTKSILCMPVRDNSGAIIAAIQMINKASGTFEEEDEELLNAFCSHAAVAILNSRVHLKEIVERKKFQALAQIMEVVSSENELEPLTNILRQKSKELLDSDKCTLFLVGPERTHLFTRLEEGIQIQIPISHGIAGHVASTGETLNIPDAYADTRFNKEIDLETGYKTNNLLCMPVRRSDNGEIVGAIQMVNKTGRSFGSMDEELLRVFSAYAATTITKVKLYVEAIEARKTLENILRSIDNYVITLSGQGMLVNSNHPVHKLFGLTPESIKHRPIWLWSSNSENDTLVRDFNRVIETSRPIKVNSYILNKGTEFEKIVNYSISPLIENDEKAHETYTSPIMWSRREHSRFLLIIDDVSDISSMKKAIYDMESKMGELKSQVTNVIEAPIQVVFSTIEKLSTGHLSLESGRKELLRCAKLLGKLDIFQPDLKKLLDGVQEETKQMILLEYSRNLSDDNVPELNSWPDFESRKKIDSLNSLNWDFDALDHSDEYLINVIYDIFDHFNLIELFHIPIDKLRAFILSVRSHYRKNPFHNFYHAFTVLQITYIILVSTNAEQYLRNIDILALVVAALCHDLDHPGVTNAFEINTQSDLAMTYNDISVQENHHCSVGFSIIRNQDCNILVGLTSEEYKELRKTVVSAILATDMAQHFEITTKLKNALSTIQLSRENREHRALLVCSILHSADLSNPVRPCAISSRWARKLRDEFHQQTQREKENGIPVTPFMIIEDDFTLAKNEVGFIDFVIRPWWDVMIMLLPGLNVCADNLAENRKYWKEIVDLGPVNKN